MVRPNNLPSDEVSFISDEAARADADRQTAALGGLALALALVLLGLVLLRHLTTNTSIEECLTGARYSCDLMMVNAK